MIIVSLIKARSLLSVLLLASLFFLLSLDPLLAAINNVAWIEKTGPSAESYGIAIDKNDDVIIAGAPSRSMCIGALRGGRSFVRKYSGGGRIAWTKQFQYDKAWIKDVAVDKKSNELYVVGDVMGALPRQKVHGTEDAFIRKFGPRGGRQWTRQFGSSEPPDVLSDRLLFAYTSAAGIAVGPGGSVVIVGQVVGSLPNQTAVSYYDAFVRKYSPNGKIYWTRQFASPIGAQAKDVTIDSSGAIYIVGSTRGKLPGQATRGRADAFIRKISPNGKTLWTRQFGRPSEDEAKGVAIDANNNVYIVGSAGPRAFVRKYDSRGKLIWHRLYSGHTALGVSVDAGGDVYVVGKTNTKRSTTEKAFARKYSGAGVLRWTRYFANGQAFEAASDSNRNLYVTGIIEHGCTAEDSYLAKFIR